MAIKIVHCNKERYDIFIGRGSKWGNPFVIGEDGNRKEVIQKYKKMLLQNKKLLKDINELKDKTLGCWCKPKACHGDILKELVEGDDIVTL